MKRWTVAVGVALALALLTLPSAPGFTISSFPLFGGEVAAASCEADAKPAPLDYILKDMNGDDVDLATFKGNVILLNFWATWCGPCKIEIPGFQLRRREQHVRGLKQPDQHLRHLLTTRACPPPDAEPS